MARFTTLNSGSSGNTAVLEENGHYLLVDMGKSCRQTIKSLYSLGLSLQGLRGICVTHEHVDHVGGLRVFLNQVKVPVFAGADTLAYLSTFDLVPPDAVLVPLEAGDPVDIFGEFEVNSFCTMHDAVGCMGFSITAASGKRLAIATDLGCMTEEVYSRLSGADLVALESNYDAGMLKSGPYPYHLKKRIFSERGHLDNRDSAATLRRLVEQGTKRIALCHLSETNNTPQLAARTLAEAMVQLGARENEDYEVRISPRHTPAPFIEL